MRVQGPIVTGTLVAGGALALFLLAPAVGFSGGRLAGSSQQEHAGHEHAPDRGFPGYAPVPLVPEVIQKFGVRTERAENKFLVDTVRTAGIVRADETRETRIHTKWSGWIDEFFASFVGQTIRKGDPLFSVYSPDLVTAQQEFLLAARAAREQPGEPNERALAAARSRLRFWDVPEETLREIERTGKLQRTVTIRAPRDGTLVRKAVAPGMYIEPSMELYVLADLSSVWVLVDLYEYEIPRISVGQKARFVPVGATGEEFEAKVAFIPPAVSPETRTVKVRLEIANDPMRLRPGEYGTVSLEIPLGEAVAIPADAVIDTGTRQVAFVHRGGGLFEPRELRLGARAGDRVQILAGIEEGEEVVTRAQFMLDSESRLRAAAAAGGKPDHIGH